MSSGDDPGGVIDQAHQPVVLDRRQFISLSVQGVAALSILPKLELFGSTEATTIGRGSLPPKRTLQITLLRREDFVNLGFDFYNLILRTGSDGATLVRLDPSREAWVVVTFPPQHVLEQGFFEAEGPAGSDALPAPGNVLATLSGGSRLGFIVPPSVASIPYDADGLLTWASWFQNVVPSAQSRIPTNQSPTLRSPQPWQTAIEIPWWLILSPSIEPGLWRHATAPKTSNGRTELWHTGLDVSPVQNLIFPALRAVWARDWDGGTGAPESRPFNCTPGTAGFPFAHQSLTPRDRAEIVVSSALFKDRYGLPTVSRPLEPERLLLSSLGGWLDVKGEWDTQSTGRSLESWIHRATGARDQYVRVVRTGFLLPLGHRAVKVVVTERKPGVPTGGSSSRSAAYLRQRVFIAVREPVRQYGHGADPFEGRGLPFTRVRLTTSVTPRLDDPSTSPLPTQPPLPPIDTGTAFVPTVAGDPFLFEAVGTDHEGRDVPFMTPLVWVDGSSPQAPGCETPGPGNAPGAGIYSPPTLAAVVGAFNALGGAAGEKIRPAIATGGLPTALAPAGAKPGSTRFDMRSFRLFAGPPLDLSVAHLDALFAQSEPPFYPIVQDAEIRLEATEVVSGSAVGWRHIRYSQPYVLGDFGPGEVFAELVTPEPLAFTKEGRGGGVATPNIELTGLSRTLGTFGGDPGSVGLGTPPNPAALLLGSAKLLGGVDLADVVALSDFDQAPVLRTTTIGPANAPTAYETRFEWHPGLKPSGIFSPVSGNDFQVRGVYLRDLVDQAKSSSLVTGELRNVTLTLVPGAKFVAVNFNRVAFRSENGKKTEVKVDIGDVTFLGALEYLAALADVVRPPDGTPTGPFLDVTPSDVTTGVAFALPAVQVGAFVLENISLLSRLRLPLNGDAVTARFAFSTREDPFHLTVLALGGGGFAAIEIGADGPKALDVSLEAGAMIALNVGVAKGKVEAFAGLYYRLENQGGSTVSVYEAFVRMGGSLRVLGLVTVSSKIYLSLDYDTGTHKYHGTAKLTYSIDLGLYEKDVSFSVHRKFARKSGDPFLTDRVTAEQWSSYCKAFATTEAS